ncbi:hypothetical protein PFISCL1PPCAC_5724, partial [Pristionchus fissidentatus]
YQLRSSQRATDDLHEYETPGMDEFNGPMLSESDIMRDSQGFELFLNGSFGGRFTAMRPLSASDVQMNLQAVSKSEEDPMLCKANFIPEDEVGLNNNMFQQQAEVWQPLGGHPGENSWPADEYDGGFVHSQGHSMPYSFVVAVMPQQKASNREYLLLDQLLFAKYNAPIPFNFLLSPSNAAAQTGIPMPSGMSIRMSLRYAEPVSDDKRVVSRCHVHSERDSNVSTNMFPFVLNHRDAVYDKTTLHVTIPSSTVVSLTFFCYSSCAGGIDRKPVFILFELLNEDGSVAQEAQMAVKVCANPSRDAPKEQERKRREEEKCGRGRVKSEASSEMGGSEKKAKKRKQEELNEMGREIRRYDSTSPMPTMTTPSPGWNPTMTAPRVAPERRDSKLDFRCGSADGVPMEMTPSSSRKSSKEEEDDDDKVYTITIRGKKKYQEVMKHVQLLETKERYSKRNDEENPFANLTQLTGEMGISTWLDQYKLCEELYVERFKLMGVNTLYDVEAAFHPTLFSTVIGIPNADAARLNKIYLNWLNLSANLDN